MKKIIALTTLVVAGSALAAGTTSTQVDVSKMAIKDRIGMWYWGESTVAKRTRSNGDVVQAVDFVNYLNTSFKVNNDITANLTLRGNFSDNNTEKQMGEGDNFSQWDTRLGADYTVFNNGTNKVRLRGVFELPTSQSSIDNDKITRAKAYVILNTKFDDHNKLVSLVNYNKDFYQDAQDSVDSTSKYYMTQWFSYTNTALSEKIVPKVELELVQRHMGGAADNYLTASSDEERLLVGAEFDVAGVSVYPFLSHDPSRVKALDQTGLGAQLFKSF